MGKVREGLSDQGRTIALSIYCMFQKLSLRQFTQLKRTLFCPDRAEMSRVFFTVLYFRVHLQNNFLTFYYIRQSDTCPIWPLYFKARDSCTILYSGRRLALRGKLSGLLAGGPTPHTTLAHHTHTQLSQTHRAVRSKHGLEAKPRLQWGAELQGGWGKGLYSVTKGNIYVKNTMRHKF